METQLKPNQEEAFSQAEAVARHDRQAIWSVLRALHRGDYNRPPSHIPVVLSVVPASGTGAPAEETAKPLCAACPFGKEGRGLAPATNGFNLPAEKAA